MNRNLDPKLARRLTSISSESDTLEAAMLRSVQGVKNKKIKEQFANVILKATENAKTVEDLVAMEMFLQTLDARSAVTEKEKASVRDAQAAYGQIVKTIEQMRRAPAEYFEANISNPETDGDFKKMPRIRGPKQIDDNIKRLHGRDSFGDEHKRQVWEARIAMAGKTKAMLKTLHNNLAANYERGLKMQEQLKQKQEQQQSRKGKGRE